MIYTSNISNVINDIESKLRSIDSNELDKVIRTAAITTQGNIMIRVFNKGKTTKGGFIGNYSVKPMLVGRKSFTKGSVWNKVFKSKRYKWVTVNGKRLKVLTGGYKQLRNIQGKETLTVNLDYSGKLKSSMITENTANGYIVGFLPYGSKISKYQEEKWKKIIFAPTPYEKGLITKIVNNFVRLKLK